MALDTVTDSFVADGLILSNGEYITDSATLASGAGALTRGTVLGKITTGGKLLKSLSTASDGSQVPFCILLVDTDATSADKVAPVLLAAEVDGAKLTLGASHTLASIKDGLRDLGIFIRTVSAV